MNKEKNVFYKAKMWFKKRFSKNKMIEAPKDESLIYASEKEKYMAIYNDIKSGCADLSKLNENELKKVWLMLREESKIKENKIKQLNKNSELNSNNESIYNRIKNNEIDISSLSISEIKSILSKLEFENANISYSKK